MSKFTNGQLFKIIWHVIGMQPVFNLLYNFNHYLYFLKHSKCSIIFIMLYLGNNGINYVLLRNAMSLISVCDP